MANWPRQLPIGQTAHWLNRTFKHAAQEGVFLDGLVAPWPGQWLLGPMANGHFRVTSALANGPVGHSQCDKGICPLAIGTRIARWMVQAG